MFAVSVSLMEQACSLGERASIVAFGEGDGVRVLDGGECSEQQVVARLFPDVDADELHCGLHSFWAVGLLDYHMGNSWPLISSMLV